MKVSMSVSSVRPGSDAGAPRSAYEKPTLDRLGTFRELTEHDDFGFFGGFFRHHPRDCMMTGSSSYTCHR
jgi:hypothetical protein